ncbi:hypothetical protein Rhal01_03420 [Rubritalea halochordaticola]|uniref:AtpZ/AtpI family protein n=1 Tax=Rubritalea halochordaticola TaxID=714537 RepID=A0ABP9V9D8_9BACT
MYKLDRFFCSTKERREFGVVWYGVFGFIVCAYAGGLVYGIVSRFFFEGVRSNLLDGIVMLGSGALGAWAIGWSVKKKFSRYAARGESDNGDHSN